MRALCLLIILCCCLSPVFAAQWAGHRVAFAVVYVHPGEEAEAEKIGILAEQEGRRLAPALGLSEIRPFPIYAYTNRGEFRRDAGMRPLLLGVSYRPTGLIRIDITGLEGPVRQILAHEMTHTLLNQRLGDHIGELPNWVNEGLAGFHASPVSPRQLPKLSRLTHQQGVLALRGLETAFDTGSGVDIAYQQSLSMVAWLEYRHPGSLDRLISALAGGTEFDMALHQAAGITPQQWLDTWRTQIPFYEILLNVLGSPAVYAPLAILIIIAAGLRVKRRREHAEAQEREEAEAASENALPYSVASTLVEIHTRGGDLSQFPIWDDIHTP